MWSKRIMTAFICERPATRSSRPISRKPIGRSERAHIRYVVRNRRRRRRRRGRRHNGNAINRSRKTTCACAIFLGAPTQFVGSRDWKEGGGEGETRGWYDGVPGRGGAGLTTRLCSPTVRVRNPRVRGRVERFADSRSTCKRRKRTLSPHERTHARTNETIVAPSRNLGPSQLPQLPAWPRMNNYRYYNNRCIMKTEN